MKKTRKMQRTQKKPRKAEKRKNCENYRKTAKLRNCGKQETAIRTCEKREIETRNCRKTQNCKNCGKWKKCFTPILITNVARFTREMRLFVVFLTTVPSYRYRWVCWLSNHDSSSYFWEMIDNWVHCLDGLWAFKSLASWEWMQKHYTLCQKV